MSNIQPNLTWRQRVARWLLKPEEFEQSLADEIKFEAELLNRDILVRELKLIDDRHRIEASRDKQRFLGQWLLNDANSSESPKP